MAAHARTAGVGRWQGAVAAVAGLLVVGAVALFTVLFVAEHGATSRLRHEVAGLQVSNTALGAQVARVTGGSGDALDGDGVASRIESLERQVASLQQQLAHVQAVCRDPSVQRQAAYLAAPGPAGTGRLLAALRAGCGLGG